VHPWIKKLDIQKWSSEDSWYLQSNINFIQKARYAQQVGLVILWCDFFLLTYVHAMISDAKSIYIGYMEILMCSVFLWNFIVKRANPCILGWLVSLLIVTLINYKILSENEKFQENMITVINGFVGHWFILKFRESEANENLESNKLLEEREENLKEILNLFPSGILFYDPEKGVVYMNEYFKDICQETLKTNEKNKNSKLQRIKSSLKVSQFILLHKSTDYSLII